MRKKRQTPRPKVKIEEQNSLPSCASDGQFQFGIAVSQMGEFNVSTIMSLCQIAPNYGDEVNQFTQDCCMDILGQEFGAGNPEGGVTPPIGGGNVGSQNIQPTTFLDPDNISDEDMSQYPCDASHPYAPKIEDYPGGGTDPDYLQAKEAFLKKCREKSRMKKGRPKPRMKTKGKTRKGLPRRSMGPQRRIQESFIKRFKKLANINSKKNGKEKN